jgi:hypothetical protein
LPRVGEEGAESSRKLAGARTLQEGMDSREKGIDMDMQGWSGNGRGKEEVRREAKGLGGNDQRMRGS